MACTCIVIYSFPCSTLEITLAGLVYTYIHLSLLLLTAFFIDFVSPDTDVYESERVYQFCLTHNRTCPDPFSVPVINMQSGDDPAGG